MVPYIISQILGILAIVLMFGVGALKVNRYTVLLCNVAINLLWAVHFFILGATSGGVLSVIAAIMLSVFCFKGKNKFMSLPVVPIFFAITYVVCGIFTWDSFWSVLFIMGNLLCVVATWNDSVIVLKSIFSVVAVLFIIYNAVYLSIMGVVGQLLALIGYIVSISRYFIDKKKKQVKSQPID